MEFTKQNEEITEVITYHSENDSCSYDFVLTKINGAVRNTVMDIQKEINGRSEHVGQVLVQNGHKSASVKYGENIQLHAGVFESFLTYIEGGEGNVDPAE